MSDASFTRALLAWYRKHRRELPWRSGSDAYAVWVSEVMLQQTQVRTVLPYFERWMRRFPDVRALAAASDEEVLRLWEGLGYYSRARRLLAGARAVVERHGGRVPGTTEELLALPGIGPYSAGAIASIAFGQRAPLVDGNVIRVLARHFGLRGDPARAPLKGELWRVAASLLPARGAGDFNQALMELGALVCTPHQPRCDVCPVRGTCAALAGGHVDELPETAPRARASSVHQLAAVAERGDQVLVQRLPDDAPRWAGMSWFPNVDLGADEAVDDALARALKGAGTRVRALGLVCTVRYTVTRFKITLDVYRVSHSPARALRADFSWHPLSQLDALGLPVAHRKIARVLGTGRRQLALFDPGPRGGEAAPRPRATPGSVRAGGTARSSASRPRR